MSRRSRENLEAFVWKTKRRFLTSRQTDALQIETLLANIFSLQFKDISEYQLSSSYRASKSRFFPYIHCKFYIVCPTTKMTSATVKPSISKNHLTPMYFQKYSPSSYQRYCKRSNAFTEALSMCQSRSWRISNYVVNFEMFAILDPPYQI